MGSKKNKNKKKCNNDNIETLLVETLKKESDSPKQDDKKDMRA